MLYDWSCCSSACLSIAFQENAKNYYFVSSTKPALHGVTFRIYIYTHIYVDTPLSLSLSPYISLPLHVLQFACQVAHRFALLFLANSKPSPFPWDASLQTMPMLGPVFFKQCLLWAMWIPIHHYKLPVCISLSICFSIRFSITKVNTFGYLDPHGLPPIHVKHSANSG